MIVSFETEELHDCCLVADVAEAILGAIHAQALATLIAEIEALETAAELLELLHPTMTVEIDDSLLLPLGADFQVRFVAAGTEFNRDGEGAINWSSVRRLKFLALEPVL